MSGIRTRYAAFIATTNDPLPLIDPTGSRRHLCILTTGKINTSDPIEYAQLYAQLKFEILNSDMKYITSDVMGRMPEKIDIIPEEIGRISERKYA